jgi:hypothetical protein
MRKKEKHTERMRNDGVALKMFKEKKREKGEIKRKAADKHYTKDGRKKYYSAQQKKNMGFFFNVRLFLIVYFYLCIYIFNLIIFFVSCLVSFFYFFML